MTSGNHKLTLTGLGILLSACAPAKSNTQSATGIKEDSMATAAETKPLADVISGKYTMDKTHGYVSFTYNHLGYSQPVLRFSGFDSVINLDVETVENSTVEATIATRSLDSGVAELDTRLMKDDFFNAETFPVIRFVSNTIEITGPKRALISGELTVKGITKPVTLDTILNGASSHPRDGFPTLGLSATTTLDRRDFDLGKLVPHVGAEIDVTISAEYNLK